MTAPATASGRARAAVAQRTLTVLHSTWCWLPLTETWLANQIRFLPDSVESHVVCERTMNAELYQPLTVHAAADAGAIGYAADRIARKLYRRHPGMLAERAEALAPDLLHSHFGHIGWRDAGWADGAGVPHVVSFYGADASALPRSEPAWRRRYRQLFALVDAVLCEGPAMGRSLEALGCDAGKITVHPLGIDLSRIPFHVRRPLTRGPLRILMAASFREKKGLPVAIRALAEARRLGLDLEATVIGGAATKAERREERRIHEALADPVLAGRVKLLGFQPHGRLLQEALRNHVFLSPSQVAADGDSEGGAPVAVIEAAASGMPVLGTLHCDIPSVLAEPNRRLLVEEGDVEGLSRALVAMQAADWAGLASANRRRVEERFDARIQGARLAAVYRGLT